MSKVDVSKHLLSALAELSSALTAAHGSQWKDGHVDHLLIRNRVEATITYAQRALAELKEVTCNG